MSVSPRPEETQLFRAEYERELDEWLRRRFGYLCIAFALIELVGVAVSSLVYVFSSVAEAVVLRQATFLSAVIGLVGLVGTAYFYRHRAHLETRADFLRATTRLILLLGGLALLELLLQRVWLKESSVSALPVLFLWHFAACLFLPWRPTESLRPMVPLLVAWAILVIVLVPGEGRLVAAVQVLFAPVILLPGMAVAAWRLRSHGQRFRLEMVGRHFRDMRTELMQARSVHEAMFPVRYDDGFVAVDYEYKPMRDVGGDFIHVSSGPGGSVALTLIDVTGHGLAAAMTVNRLYGEIERLRAEDAGIEPVDLLTALNRYIHLTLSRHNIYATAVSIELDPVTATARYANAGHPPVFVRTVNGRVTELESTGMILGAVGDREFECEQVSLPVGVGDTIVAFTDGVIEAMNRRDEHFGLDRVRDALGRLPAPSNWPQFLVSLAGRHQAGRSQDDVLVAAIRLVKFRVRQRAPEALQVRA